MKSLGRKGLRVAQTVAQQTENPIAYKESIQLWAWQ